MAWPGSSCRNFCPRPRNWRRGCGPWTRRALQRLWKCNDAIAAQNQQRLARMDLERGLTPAILAYEGIQYRYMAPEVFTQEQLDYIQQHLRILSGLYGVLRPLDGVQPYRLEMQAKLAGENFRDLYGFWGQRLAASLCREADCILNLASKEYSLAVSRHLPENVRLVNCLFAEEKEGRLVEKAPSARWPGVRWFGTWPKTRSPTPPGCPALIGWASGLRRSIPSLTGWYLSASLPSPRPNHKKPVKTGCPLRKNLEGQPGFFI